MFTLILRVVLKSLIENLTPQHLANWGQKLAVELMKKGAPPTTLTFPTGDPELHVAMNIGLATGIT